MSVVRCTYGKDIWYGLHSIHDDPHYLKRWQYNHVIHWLSHHTANFEAKDGLIIILVSFIITSVSYEEEAEEEEEDLRAVRINFDLSTWSMCHKIHQRAKRPEGFTTRLEFRVIIFNGLNNSYAWFSWRLDLDSDFSKFASATLYWCQVGGGTTERWPLNFQTR